MTNLGILISSNKTVFTTQEAKLLLGMDNMFSLRNFLHRQKKSGLMGNPYRGIWTLPNYDIFELASKLRKNSYISLQTVLSREGIIFQEYGNMITLVSDNTLTKKIGTQKFSYHKIRNNILVNPLGIISTEKYDIASPERAICDYIYLYKQTSFDAPEHLNISLLEKLQTIYPQSTVLNIKKLITHVGHTKT